jgi:hypothetical protein
VDPNVSAIERAFQLARAGKAKDMKGLQSILKTEGYMNGQLDNMPSLAKLLRSIMEAARPRPASKQQRSPDSRCFPRIIYDIGQGSNLIAEDLRR